MLRPQQRTAEDPEEGAIFPIAAVEESQPGLGDLVQALALREETLGVLAHELRNPLSAILALARGTLGREDLTDDVRGRFQQVDRAAQRSLAIIDSVLDFSERRQRGTVAVRVVPAEPVAVAAAVVDELRAANPERMISLEARGSRSFLLDPIRIGQVLSNLIGNALEHGFPHTPVEVTVDVRDGEALLAVRNQGPVIPPERVPSLFEPFTHASGRRVRDTGILPAPGLGLGLYIVHALVQAHGGTVDVESDAVRGTTFVVRLPERAGGLVKAGP